MHYFFDLFDTALCVCMYVCTGVCVTMFSLEHLNGANNSNLNLRTLIPFNLVVV